MKFRYLTLVTTLVTLLLTILVIGCGGGGGGNSIFRGSWLGAWSDYYEEDTGFYSVNVSGSGSFNGTATNDLCGSSGSATGSFGNSSTKLNMKFNENNVCYKYSVKASGDPMTPYANGYSTVVDAKYYDRFGTYIGTVVWAVYMERNFAMGPDAPARITVKQLTPRLSGGQPVDMSAIKKGDGKLPSPPIPDSP